ncbi:MAG: DNA repair exonuclease [Cyanobacteria bacterium M5B4]|nr:MAG: DNA repair exonuclease [Cyanobacteria bacterium M5B4]
MRIVHLADLHLGFRAYSRTNDQGVNCREADVFRTFRQALNKISTLKPDLLLIAGDVFHVTRPGNLAVVQTQRLLHNFIATTGIETIVIAGNHESVKTRDSSCILELFGLIEGVRVVCQQAEVLMAGDIRVACLPHNSLLEADHLDLRPDREAKYNVLMLHGTVDGNLVNDAGGANVPADFLEMDWDYVACGHFHGFRHMGRFIYYAGAIERTSNDIWKEAEEEKGFIEFDLEHKKAIFHPLPTRKTIDLPTIDAANKTIEVLDKLIADNVKQTDITDAIVRQQVINLPKSLQNQLDYRQIRTFQAMALHYLFVPKPLSLSIDQSFPSAEQKGSLYEEAEQFFNSYAISPDIDRATFVKTGLDYLQKATV